MDTVWIFLTYVGEVVGILMIAAVCFSFGRWWE